MRVLLQLRSISHRGPGDEPEPPPAPPWGSPPPGPLTLETFLKLVTCCLNHKRKIFFKKYTFLNRRILGYLHDDTLKYLHKNATTEVTCSVFMSCSVCCFTSKMTEVINISVDQSDHTDLTVKRF